MANLSSFTVARQYMLTSFILMLLGMIVIGLWISDLIETAVTNRTAAVTALYVNSFISPYLSDFDLDTPLSPEQIEALDTLLTDNTFSQQVVSFKIWSPDGTIIFSPVAELIGQQFAVEGGLSQALRGEVVSEVSQLDDPEQVYERQFWDTLIETYAPARDSRGDIVAVAEFYQTTTGLESEIRRAQIRSWIVIGLVLITLYLLLAGIVGRASNTILLQQNRLQENVDQLQILLEQNDQLNGRVRRAAARTTALNERYLRRISAELHDGPAQDLALALLRFENFAEANNDQPSSVKKDFDTIHTAIESAMRELRNISAGLRLPEIETLSLLETIQRAIHDFEKRTGAMVRVTVGPITHAAPVPVKITVYRLLRETLANSHRHSQANEQLVYIYQEEEKLIVQVSDDGIGFSPENVPVGNHLGLAGLRERVTVLGGEFLIDSQLQRGTMIKAIIPLNLTEEAYE